MSGHRRFLIVVTLCALLWPGAKAEAQVWLRWDTTHPLGQGDPAKHPPQAFRPAKHVPQMISPAEQVPQAASTDKMHADIASSQPVSAPTATPLPSMATATAPTPVPARIDPSREAIASLTPVKLPQPVANASEVLAPTALREEPVPVIGQSAVPPAEPDTREIEAEMKRRFLQGP